MVLALAKNDSRLENMNQDLIRLVESVDKLAVTIERLHSRRPSDQSIMIHDDVFT